MEDEFDKTMKDIKEQLIDRIKRQQEEIERLKNIIKEVRECIEKHTENIDRGRYYEDYVETYPILEILDKVEENK